MGNAKMRYALVDGEKRLPEENLHGRCPLCGAPVTSKCGNVKIHHWAHAPGADCDSWSEGKTEWHVAWQNLFPMDWQEVTIEKDGQKHRADVQIPKAENRLPLIIEFQHSYIEAKELKDREDFYGNMLWVVDMSKKKRDSGLFLDILNRNFSMKALPKMFWIKYRSFIPRLWMPSKRPVFLDFSMENSSCADTLFCIFPQIPGDDRWWIGCYPRQDFIKECVNGSIGTTLVQQIQLNYQKTIELVKGEILIQVRQSQTHDLFRIPRLHKPRL